MCLANNSSAFTLATILIIFFFPFLKSQSYPLFLLSLKKKVQILWSLFLQWPLYPLSNFICISLFHLISLWHLSEPFSINRIFLHHVCSLFKGINVIAATFQICGIFKFDKTHSLTYALSSPQRMLIISGYTCLASKAMHRSQRLPYLGEDEGKERTHSRSIYLEQSLRHHLTVTTTFCIITVS